MNKGFTLLECLFVLSILAIFSGLSLPQFNNMIERKQSELALKKIADGIEIARNTAIKTGYMVTLCPSVNQINCGGQWHEGNIVFTDFNQNHQFDKEDRLLLNIQHSGLPGTIKWRAFQNRQYLQITPLGFTHNQNGNFTFCSQDLDPYKALQLVINRTGRVRYATDANGDGIREDSQGKPLNC